jgi:hypothetical protein
VSFASDVKKYLDDRVHNSRYASFDYCFNYFQSFREGGNTGLAAAPENIELSCLHLGFYLASWGMLRGSAKLLKHSARQLIPVIQLIADADTAFWNIDANSYTEANITRLTKMHRLLQLADCGMSDTLTTKIMLGVFGNVPAFDVNFKCGFGMTRFGTEALRKIGIFYKKNHGVIEENRAPTLDFAHGGSTSRKYTRAKVIDMAFFIRGTREQAP